MKFVLLFVACFMAHHGAESGLLPDIGGLTTQAKNLVIYIQAQITRATDQLAALQSTINQELAQVLARALAQGEDTQCIQAVQDQLNTIAQNTTASAQATIADQQQKLQDLENAVTAAAANPLQAVTALPALITKLIAFASALVNTLLGVQNSVASVQNTLTQVQTQLQGCIPAAPVGV